MAFLQANESGYIVKDYKYQRYPLVMHRGQHPDIQSIQVKSEEEEKAAAAKGYSLTRPPVAEPVPERPTLSVEERLDEMEERIAVMEERLAGFGQPSEAQPEHESESEDESDEETPADAPKRRGRGRPPKVSHDE